jgi:trk system potassium uptake protein TrkA
MNIIICGAGRVGFTIAKLLSEQGHSITVIDQSSEDIQKIDDVLDVKSIVGKASYPSILEKANASDADMIIAVTRSDEINMLICQIAFSIFNVSKKIARIRSQDYLNPKFTKVYNKENLPIDVIISPEIEIAKSLQRKLEAPGALDNVPFANNQIRLLEILINENCPLINIKLNELTKKFPKLDANIMGVIRNDKYIILKKNDVMHKGDKAYLIINASQMSDTLQAFGHNEKISNKILIIGGGNIGFNLAKNLEESFESARVKIIEKNKERAEFIANELNNTIIINGNGLDEDTLLEANIDEVETVLALTNDDEDNLMVSVLVEKFSKDKDKDKDALNNKRTMALINKSNYSLLQSSLKIDDLIDPRMNTVSSILKHVHKGSIETAYSILNGEYEVIEAEIIDTSELINKELKNSNLPDEIRIGAILRGKNVIIPRSNFVFKKEDIVVFLAKKNFLQVVENMFRISSI